MRTIAFALGLFVAACSAEPRSRSYFETHPNEAREVLAACKVGHHRGTECENAHAWTASEERKARMEMARRGFREQWR